MSQYLQRGREGLAWLDDLSYPSVLKPVVLYLRRRLSISLWIEEERLRYYKSWDESVLKEDYAGLQPEQSCRPVLEKLADVMSTGEKYQIAQHDWSNCMIGAADERYGHLYPIDAWKLFLAAYDLKEHYKDKSPD